MKRADLNALAYELADEAARSDIECNCMLGRVDTYRWWDTNAFPPHHGRLIRRAMRYLDGRKRLIRRAAEPHLVRFEDGP